MTSQYEDFSRNDTGWSGAALQVRQRRATRTSWRKLDLATPCDMRAPGAATGVYALECAMDELAVALKIDPVELRLRNYSDRDQNEDKPYTSKQLRECYRQGAEAFGWARRNPEPRSMRDGSELVGWGMATGVWEALQMQSRAAHRADRQRPCRGRLRDLRHRHRHLHDHGAGRRRHARPADRQRHASSSAIRRCRTSPVEGGSWTAASVGARDRATPPTTVRKRAAGAGAEDAGLAARRTRSSTTSMLADGKIVSKQDASRAVSIADAMRHGKVERIEQEQTAELKDDASYARNTHSAVFAEVKVDEELGVIRVTRVVNAVAAGRILNPKTARSQIMGGVVWGIGMALHEETLIDHRFGRIMNHNLAEYHVPVNADVHDIEVIFVDEPDDDHQSARHQGRRRDRHRRRRRGDRQRGLSRDRQARARPADHAGQAAALTRSRGATAMSSTVS